MRFKSLNALLEVKSLMHAVCSNGETRFASLDLALACASVAGLSGRFCCKASVGVVEFVSA